MIHVRTAADIHVLNNRYAVAKDMAGTLRVISLVRVPYRELQPRENTSGISYVFNRTGTGPSWDKSSYNQSDLHRLVLNYGKRPRQDQLDQLERDGAVSFAIEARVPAGLGKSEIMGIPTVDNHQLDPQKGGWVIATVTKNGLLFGSKPKVHTNPGAAEAELQRLATVSPGTEFVLLKAMKTAVTQTVQTKSFA